MPRISGRMTRRAFLATGAALAACQTAPPMSAAPGLAPSLGTASASASAVSSTVTVDGVSMHLSRTGRGRPVCLIHGASGNLNDMTFRLGPALADRYEVIAIDRPGHGRSGLPSGGGVSINVQAALIRGALDRLGIERPIVVGHSYGGAVALAWAVDAPGTVSGLVLLAAPSQVWEGGLGLTNDLLASPVTGPPLAHAIPHLVTRGFADRTLRSVFDPQAVPEGYLDHLGLDLVLRPESLREDARQLVALKEELRPMIPSYPGLSMPIRLVHGDADRTVGLDIHSAPFARQVPQAGLTRLPGIGHMIHQIATARAIEAVDAVIG